MKREKRHFNGECDKEADSDNILLYCIKLAIHKNKVARTSGKKVEIKNSEKHEQGAEEGVQEEVVCGLNFAVARTSDTDKNKHRNKEALKEDEEVEEVCCREG